MKWLQNTYTRRFNSRHKKWGRLFGDRYKSILVDDSNVNKSDGHGSYLATLIEYIHLNPARAQLVRSSEQQSILEYPWSSVGKGYVMSPDKRPHWLDVKGGLALYDYQDNYQDRRRYVARLDQRIAVEEAEKCGLAKLNGQTLQSTLRRGWYWGSESFRERLLALIKPSAEYINNRNFSSSEQGRDKYKFRAEWIIERGTSSFSLADSDTLLTLKRGDRRRVAVAWALCRKTTMSQRWIADRTGLSTPANVSQQTRRYDRLILGRELPADHLNWVAQILKIVD